MSRIKKVNEKPLKKVRKRSRKKSRKKILKKWVRVSLVLFVLVVFLISIKMISDSFTFVSPKRLEYAYNINQNLDYKVYVYDNSYIENDYIEKDELYMADLIKSIDVSFFYNYSGSKVLPLKYEYNIKGVINGFYKTNDEGDSKLWKKEYTLLNTQAGEITDVNNIRIKEDLSLDYSFYDEVVSNFRKELKLPINATLDITMTISMYGEGELLGKLVDTQTMSMSIPLNLQVFQISNNYEPIISKNVITNTEVKNIVNVKRLICGILVAGVGVVLLVGLFDKIFIFKQRTNYDYKLSKILKDYGDVIVEVITQTPIDELSVIEVKSFSEMIDLEEELRIPIMFYELEESYIGEFTLIHGNIMYKYILDNEED